MAQIKKLLFLPGFSGGGFGHIGACLEFAKTFQKQGGKSVFLLGGPHIHRVAEAGFKTYKFKFWETGSSTAAPPAYTLVNSLNYQVVRDGLDHPLRVEFIIRQAARIIHMEKPDMLIGDSNLLAHLIGARNSIPVVQLTKAYYHPQPIPLVTWEDPPADQILPDIHPIFDPVLKWSHLSPLSRTEDLIQGDLYLVRGSPSLDPMSPLPQNTFYLGSLKKAFSENRSDPVLEISKEKKQPIVYVTIGGASQSGVSNRLFQLFNRAFSNLPYTILISTGGKPIPDIQDQGKNIYFEEWVNNDLILKHAALVIFHGGSTRLEVLQHGLPSITIPFQSEQEHYARRMQELKTSRYLPYSSEPYTHREARWRGGKFRKSQPFSIYLRKNPTLAPQTLRDTFLEVMNEPCLKQNAQNVMQEFKQLHGCEQGLQIIQDFFS